MLKAGVIKAKLGARRTGRAHPKHSALLSICYRFLKPYRTGEECVFAIGSSDSDVSSISARDVFKCKVTRGPVEDDPIARPHRESRSVVRVKSADTDALVVPASRATRSNIEAEERISDSRHADKQPQFNAPTSTRREGALVSTLPVASEVCLCVNKRPVRLILGRKNPGELSEE